MVMEELCAARPAARQRPVIVSEFDKLPWTGPEFRRWWRLVADACGCPRPSAIWIAGPARSAEATDAGADSSTSGMQRRIRTFR